MDRHPPHHGRSPRAGLQVLNLPQPETRFDHNSLSKADTESLARKTTKMPPKTQSYALGKWHTGSGAGQQVCHAITGAPVALIDAGGLDLAQVLDHARSVGGPTLRQMTFHQRALALRSMAKAVMARKEELYEISKATGATRADSWIDIEGGSGTLSVYASLGRREFPDQTFHVEDDLAMLSRGGTFLGRHLCVPLQGAALHLNAFNFPCWGLLEKFSCSFLAGVPSIVKPAPQTAYVAEALVRVLVEADVLPEGALQLLCLGNHEVSQICGPEGSGDLFSHLTSQDVVTFTGSAATGLQLKSHPNLLRNNTRFNLEADSLNSIVLGPDVTPQMPEFPLFIKEVVREMTVKAGQKCTAIRRVLVPKERIPEVLEALQRRLEGVRMGDPEQEGVRMGALVDAEQARVTKARVEELRQEAEVVYKASSEATSGAFCEPVLLHCPNPRSGTRVHEVEAFGPVSTVMPFETLEEAVDLAARGQGSLVATVVTADSEIAGKLVLGLAPYHGRLLVLNQASAAESTGHGSPMPQLVHGGPGRAGGGQELGGIRGVLFYMQRVALQGNPEVMARITGEWIRGAEQREDRVHPFRKHFDELEVGETLWTHRRTVTEADVVNFAGVSGDWFYAHVDEIAVQESPVFEKRVAHGYFVLAAAAGLFVHPAPGPVLANYGLDNLRFIQPVYIGDTLQVRLTCKRKTPKPPRPEEVPQGVVAWDVEVFNQHQQPVAVYTILTLVARTPQPSEALPHAQPLP